MAVQQTKGCKKLKYVICLVFLAVLCCSVQSASAQNGPVPLALGNYPVWGNATQLALVNQGPHQASVQAFYQGRQYQLAWFTRWGKSSQADTLLQLLEEAPLWGLHTTELKHPALDNSLDQLAAGKANLRDIEHIDYWLTEAFMNMSWQLGKGQFTKQHEPSALQRHPVQPDLIAALEQGLREGRLRQVLAAQEPPHLQYHLLKKHLQKLIQQQQQSAAAAAGVLDEQISRIILNLDRWRWEAPQLPDAYIWVNLPAYQLQLVQKGQAVFQARVIVGKPATPSPELEGLIECFIIYPYWSVPRSIGGNEILPKVKKDLGYLRRQGFDVLDQSGRLVEAGAVKWDSYTAKTLPYTFRQREGTDNALGIVKFSFDNPFSVYLHDTNNKKLFNNPMRALSHGCIRVEKAEQLAHHLVKDDTLYNKPGVLDQYFAQHQKKEVTLKAPMPLYIRYFTAEVLQDSLIFYPDVYRKDEKLIRALEQLPRE